MLDKSVPYSKLYMCRKPGTPIPAFTLPEGFKFTFFTGDDDTNWAKLETSVLEFDSEFAALLYFKEEYMPYVEELYRRCLFIENSEGKKVATATAWWSFIDGERRPWLHWVCVDPEYQGLGLGKAISARVTGLLLELEGDNAFYLSTQTWSHIAISIYRKCGYEPTDEKILYGKKYRNDYKKTLKILKKLGYENL